MILYLYKLVSQTIEKSASSDSMTSFLAKSPSKEQKVFKIASRTIAVQKCAHAFNRTLR